MIEQLKSFTKRGQHHQPNGPGHASLAPLRGAAAQLLLATGASSTLEQMSQPDSPGDQPELQIPRPLAWAPMLIGPLTAAANLEHGRRPTERTALAVRFLSAATIGFGGSLFLLDSLAHRHRPPTRLAPLAFASAGLLGLIIERQERAIIRSEAALRQRARVVDRLVPRRKAKFDRVVVHV